jgi:hypothetical protein
MGGPAQRDYPVVLQQNELRRAAVLLDKRVRPVPDFTRQH